MYWQDERLAYFNTGYKKRLALNAKMVQHMWIPDIYFVNEKSGIKHDLTKENEVVRLWPDGRVFHSMRYATPRPPMAAIQPLPPLPPHPLLPLNFGMGVQRAFKTPCPW